MPLTVSFYVLIVLQLYLYLKYFSLDILEYILLLRRKKVILGIFSEIFYQHTNIKPFII